MISLYCEVESFPLKLLVEKSHTSSVWLSKFSCWLLPVLFSISLGRSLMQVTLHGSNMKWFVTLSHNHCFLLFLYPPCLSSYQTLFPEQFKPEFQYCFPYESLAYCFSEWLFLLHLVYRYVCNFSVKCCDYLNMPRVSFTPGLWPPPTPIPVLLPTIFSCEPWWLLLVKWRHTVLFISINVVLLVVALGILLLLLVVVF